MVFSVDDKVLIKSLYQSATVVKRWFWLYILVTCVTFHQVNSFIDCMFYMYCSYYCSYFIFLFCIFSVPCTLCIVCIL